MFGIRKTLKIGSIVFGLSALLLLLAPSYFLHLLLMDEKSDQLIWSMEMIGITLVALAGNMWVNSSNSDDKSVRRVGGVMAICATGLGALTMAIPVEIGWFAIAYAIVGFAFGVNYALCLWQKIM
jgi:hypothetical protein